MKKMLGILSVLLLLFGFLSCSSTKSGKTRENPVRFKERIGRVTKVDFQNKSRMVLVSRHHFQYEREENSEGQLYVETLWRFRTPFDDELASNVSEARSKIILTAYPRELTNPAGLWVASIEGRNEVKLEGGQGWVTLPLTEEAKKYFANIAEDLRIEYRMGVREF